MKALVGARKEPRLKERRFEFANRAEHQDENYSEPPEPNFDAMVDHKEAEPRCESRCPGERRRERFSVHDGIWPRLPQIRGETKKKLRSPSWVGLFWNGDLFVGK
ncbi:MAG TPA: hypothetical protein VH985_08555 [Candidatus Binatia bacterium]|jgi:hypothetical protein